MIIIDDPYKGWTEAQSAKNRQSVQDWFDGTLWSRRRPGCSVIVIQTRWHRDDLTGYLTRKPDDEPAGHEEHWAHLKIPAEAAKTGDILGRKEGEPLCQPNQTVEAAKRDFASVKRTPRVWHAVYQQDPLVGKHGRCYYNYGDHNVTKLAVLRPNLPLRISFDWNINPGMHATVSQFDPANRELVISHGIHSPGMKVSDCVEAFIDLIKKEGGFDQFSELVVLGDATGVQRSVQTGLASTVVALNGLRRSEDIRIDVVNRIPTANPGVAGSVEATNGALMDEVSGKISVFVHPGNARAVGTDLGQTPANDQGLPDKDPNAALSHFSDCVRYDVWDCMPLRIQPSTATPTPKKTRNSMCDASTDRLWCENCHGEILDAEEAWRTADGVLLCAPCGEGRWRRSAQVRRVPLSNVRPRIRGRLAGRRRRGRGKHGMPELWQHDERACGR